MSGWQNCTYNWKSNKPPTRRKLIKKKCYEISQNNDPHRLTVNVGLVEEKYILHAVHTNIQIHIHSKIHIHVGKYTMVVCVCVCIWYKWLCIFLCVFIDRKIIWKGRNNIHIYICVYRKSCAATHWHTERFSSSMLNCVYSSVPLYIVLVWLWCLTSLVW